MAPRMNPADARAGGLAGIPARSMTGPARAGAVPPLAAAFTVRADSVPDGIESMLVPGATVALVPAGESGGHPGGWLRSCGKTQLAAHLAETLWQSRRIEVLAWVDASSRASVLSGYAEAAARLGLDDGSDAESVAGRFAGWLAGTARRWLLVLDDLRHAADLDGLWPGGPAGRVLITTAADAALVPDVQQAVAVPVFGMREAMAHLFGRLSTDQDQRSGAYDLAEHLGGEPAALAQASVVMADSGTGCRDYQYRFTEKQARLRAAGGGEPPASAATWLLSAEYAEEQLLPGGSTWPLLLLTALLDGHGIPAAVITAPAACKYLADTGAGYPPGPQQAWRAALALERAGLVSIGPAGEPAVWVSTPLQVAARATASPELLGRAAGHEIDLVDVAAQLRVTPASPPEQAPRGRPRDGELLPTPTALLTWRTPQEHMAWRRRNGRTRPCDLQAAVGMLPAPQEPDPA